MTLCQVFAPTSLSLTFETEGPGALTTDEIEKIVVRNAAGEVTELRMSNRMVIMANHQVSFHLALFLVQVLIVL